MPSLSNCIRSIILVRAYGTPERTRSGKEDVREWLTAAGAVVSGAHDVFPEARKDVLQVCRLELIIAPQGAGRDGDGHAVRGEVRDEPRDAW